jgi:hypothetical protein
MNASEKVNLFEEEDYNYLYKENFERLYDGRPMVYIPFYVNETGVERTSNDENTLCRWITVLFDVEVDPYEVEFDYDGVKINTRGYTHILMDLYLIEQIQDMYDDFKRQQKLEEEYENNKH